ncbi:MAG: DUF2079 domain-containing protein [Oscillospiraceae bacterium]|nr:DUF2079 domain-containing protein [Oscillospiraceae bacterium]
MPTIKYKPAAADIVRCLVLSWLLAAMLEYLFLPEALRSLTGLDGLRQMSLSRILVLTVLFTGALTALGLYIRTHIFGRFGILFVFTVLSFAAIDAGNGEVFTVLCLMCIGLFICFAIRGWNTAEEEKREIKKAHWGYVAGTAGLAVLFFLIVSAWTVARVESMSTPSYDFGIFSQMFHYMKTTGLPLTTLERDGLLSHFAVHVSPIYYLMLPFYCLFPTPATLQALQAAVMASAVIPLWLIGKEKGLSGFSRLLLCTILLCIPAFAGGVSYDLHENCFLTPLLLWLFYGLEKKNIPITAVSAILTLTVKEDAAVYVAVIGLYLLVKTVLRGKTADKQNLITGSALLGVSLIWFFAVTGYLAQSGDGVMTYRYDNFIYDGSGSLLTVIKAVLMNPMKALYECVDAEKLAFINLTLLPLLCLPFFTRRYERYILLIPYVLVNLMSDYQYQHNIFFQYTFGSNAFLIYLTAINVADLKIDWKQMGALAATAVVAFAFFTANILPKVRQYQETASTYQDYYSGVRAALDTVPEDASVTTTTFYTTYLSQRDILYDIRYCSREHLLETEYVVLKVSATADYKKYATGGQDNGFTNVVALLEANGYKEYHRTSVLVIYHKPAS